MKNFILLLLFVFSLDASAQKPVKTFTLIDMNTGTAISLDSYASFAGVVVIFTSNECPYDAYYTDRLATLIKAYSGKIPFLLVNAHLDPEESAEKMKSKATSWPFAVPYLADKDQVAMSALGGKRSPEAFLLKHVKENFVVLYAGAIDDNPQEPAAVTTQHLRNAIDNILAGKPVAHSEERAVGCSIRKK